MALDGGLARSAVGFAPGDRHLGAGCGHRFVRALKFCLERGYAGRLYPVNARHDRVQGVRAYRHRSDLPEAPDVAAVSVGGAVMISDAASNHGLNLVEYPADALAALKATNSFVNDRKPIDVSAPSMSDMAGSC